MPTNSSGCGSVFLVVMLSIFAFIGYDLYKIDVENKEQIRKEEEYKNLPKVVPIPDSIKLSWDGSVHNFSGWAVAINIYGRYNDILIRRDHCRGLFGEEFNNCIEDFHLNPGKYLSKISTLKKPHWCCSFWTTKANP